MSSSDYARHIFTFSREPPFPTQYPENKTPVTVDVLEVGWIVAFIVGYIAFMILLPTISTKERVHYSCRITLTFLIGGIIMVCNFGHEWEEGTVTSKMFYKAGSAEEIEATVGVKLGLRGVNITLYADPESLRRDLAGETINYNERFYWTWSQGRAGFGPFGGQLQRDYREAQLKGAPYPILWVAEYFTFDGEGLRFGRHYRHAGWYAHIAVWSAGVCWVLAIILFKICIQTGSMMLSLLGGFLLTAALIWCSFRNFTELGIVFSNDNLRGILRTHYGANWYLALFTGTFCLLSGIGMIIADRFYHDELCRFFGLNPFAISDEDYIDEEVEALEDQAGIEMQTTDKFKREKRMTVIYKARGTKKYIKKNEQSRHDFANEDFFNEENNPAMDEEYMNFNYDPNYQAYGGQGGHGGQGGYGGHGGQGGYGGHGGQQQQSYYPHEQPIAEWPEHEESDYQDVATNELHQPHAGGHSYQAYEGHAAPPPHLHFEGDYFNGQEYVEDPPLLPPRKH